MDKTNKILVFKIEATIEISGSDLYCFGEIQDVLEHLQGFGVAEVTDIEIKEADKKVKC